MAMGRGWVVGLLIAGMQPSCALRKPFEPERVAGRIVPAGAWGGRTLADQPPPRRHALRLITLHHGGEDFPQGRDVPRHLRNLQEWSRREKRWVDIPYHFVIDLQGRTYACRPLDIPGDTNTGYDPTGHALVCVLGNYETASPAPEQLGAVEDLLALLCIRYGLGPETIAGHKDHAEGTVCPGRNLYAQLANGRIQAGVRRRLAMNSRSAGAGRAD